MHDRGVVLGCWPKSVVDVDRDDLVTARARERQQCQRIWSAAACDDDARVSRKIIDADESWKQSLANGVAHDDEIKWCSNSELSRMPTRCAIRRKLAYTVLRLAPSATAA